MDVSMLNMSQEDLDAAQMYAIHGERFFEMPMGRRYRRSLYPSSGAIMSQAVTPATSQPAATRPPTPPTSDMYASNGHFNTWQTTPMSLYSMQATTTTTTPPSTTPTPPESLQSQNQRQMTAPVCTDSNLYTANFPPLPAPNQKRHKD
ncbi:mucin-2-like [Drosophila innubila]|uniref:mucin-2-like n=1 Tax=Drosophila innubila TaxID=198719 RepID=UPI00148B539C|nr:mucin-2-like [Drosophila innubila]